jgi:hypothetical protein
MSPPSSESKTYQETRNQREAGSKQSSACCLKMEVTCFSETSVEFNGVHCVMSQKIALFITTAVGRSNPTEVIFPL